MQSSGMTSATPIDTIRNFLALVQEGLPPSNEQLAQALDELATAYHSSPEGEPAEEDREPQGLDYKVIYAELGERFPALGMYAVADPTEPVAVTHLVGDAIDDLADITRDLAEVAWRFDNVSADDAYWHLKLLYRSHWGRHLRELSLYLHATTW